MIAKIRIPLVIAFVMAILLGVWYYLHQRTYQDVTLVTVSTDKQVYQVGDTIHISIQNLGNVPIDIYCPEFCNLGNFPTTVERFSNGQWQLFHGFCPSIMPLFENSGTHEGNEGDSQHYIRHTLPAKSSFEFEQEIFDFTNIRLGQNARLRIVYYLGTAKMPIYSNEFAIKH